MKRIVLIALLLSVFTMANAIMVKMETAELTDNADYILTGKIVGVESHWTADHKSIVTDVRVMVGSPIKGNVNSSEITVRQPGGTTADLGLWLEDSPVFRSGEEVILFLIQQSDGTYLVKDQVQGKYTVVGDTVVEKEMPMAQFLNEITACMR